MIGGGEDGWTGDGDEERVLGEEHPDTVTSKFVSSVEGLRCATHTPGVPAVAHVVVPQIASFALPVQMQVADLFALAHWTFLEPNSPLPNRVTCKPAAEEDMPDAESDTSVAAGLTDALDCTEEDFTREEARAAGFMGKYSDITLLQRLQLENKYGDSV
jgi:hypothetical protein